MEFDRNFMIALGGNLPSQAGCPSETLDAALRRLKESCVEVIAVSRYYNTPCFPPGAGPDYVNAAALLNYDQSAPDLLRLLHEIEAEFGRERAQRWGRRTLDLDLIAAGNQVYPDPATYVAWRDLTLEKQMTETPSQLILPHPRLQDRAFVLVPLADIAPDWVHPVLKLSVSQMLKSLPSKAVSEISVLSDQK